MRPNKNTRITESKRNSRCNMRLDVMRKMKTKIAHTVPQEVGIMALLYSRFSPIGLNGTTEDSADNTENLMFRCRSHSSLCTLCREIITRKFILMRVSHRQG